MKVLLRVFFTVVATLLAVHAKASNLVPMGIEEMAARSALVLEGRVLRTECRQDAAGRIYTRIELEVQEAWKGTPSGNPFVIVHGGGTLNGRRVTVSDQVEFQAGEEIVAFLVLNQRGEGVSLGLAQGKFSVWKDATSERRYAFNPFHGRPRTLIRVGQSPGVSRHPELLSLEVLKQRVQRSWQ
jgi:hypothetical protein